jgi:hypothetical protein
VKTKEQVKAEIEIQKNLLLDAEFVNETETLAFKQGYVKALRWILED